MNVSEERYLEDLREEGDITRIFHKNHDEAYRATGRERQKSAEFYFILKDQGSGFKNEELKQKALKAIDAGRFEKNPLFDYLVSYGGDTKNNLGINLKFTKNIAGQKEAVEKFLTDREIITQKTYPVIDGQELAKENPPMAA